MEIKDLKDYIVFDVETTGLSPRKNELIEISAVKIRDGAIADTFSKLVKPEEKVNYFVEKLTGISNEMLENERPISVVLPEFLAFVGNDIMIGHNVRFDMGFISAARMKVENLDFANDTVDTLRLSKQLLDIPKHNLGVVAECLGVKSDTWHRALADCVATYKIFLKLQEMM